MSRTERKGTPTPVADLPGLIGQEIGVSRWITGPAARRQVHAQRATHDAVMVGIGTVLADDPDLTVRDLGVSHQPVRIVIDSNLPNPCWVQVDANATATLTSNGAVQVTGTISAAVWRCRSRSASPTPPNHDASPSW